MMKSQLTEKWIWQYGNKTKILLGRRNPCAVAQRQNKTTKSKQPKTDTFSHGEGHTVPNVCRIDFEEGSCKELSETLLILNPIL